jgi:hypothetical protein
MNPHLDDQLKVIAAVLVIVVVIGATIWWLPQKWTACGKLYDNKAAQVFTTRENV